jgi:methylenetetrahydrofolate dehydrogenase (NADP+)/methenyltetrahydrofolate cyclohydrolase
MAIVICGKELATLRRGAMKEEVSTFREKYGSVPHLAVVLVGEDPGSVTFVAGKEMACIEIGIKNSTIRRPNTISQDELLAIVNELNQDDSVDGILVQLPLPKHMDSDFFMNAIVPEKDVDGFHPYNVASVYLYK